MWCHSLLEGLRNGSEDCKNEQKRGMGVTRELRGEMKEKMEK